MDVNIDNLIKMIADFIDLSNVNLGRKTKRKEEFIESLTTMIRDYFNKQVISIPAKNIKQNNIISIKPNAATKKRLMDNANMTGSESMKADQELGRSPFA